MVRDVQLGTGMIPPLENVVFDFYPRKMKQHIEIIFIAKMAFNRTTGCSVNLKCNVNGNVQDVCKKCASCVQVVRKMCARCVQDVCKMCARCVQGVLNMYARCIHIYIAIHS